MKYSVSLQNLKKHQLLKIHTHNQPYNLPTCKCEEKKVRQLSKQINSNRPKHLEISLTGFLIPFISILHFLLKHVAFLPCGLQILGCSVHSILQSVKLKVNFKRQC